MYLSSCWYIFILFSTHTVQFNFFPRHSAGCRAWRNVVHCSFDESSEQRDGTTVTGARVLSARWDGWRQSSDKKEEGGADCRGELVRTSAAVCSLPSKCLRTRPKNDIIVHRNVLLSVICQICRHRPDRQSRALLIQDNETPFVWSGC